MADARPTLEAVLGVQPDGGATGQWLEMIRKRLPAVDYSAIAASKVQLTGDEREWVDLIQSRTAAWQGRRSDLIAPYAPTSPPRHVLIVMGNRGGSDAFTHDAVTIGFDLSALAAAYGDASLPENADRIDRLFDHEYTHLMQKAWLVDHPYLADSPMRAALLDIWLEGLGNHRSLSTRWRAADGRLSQTAEDALAPLKPRFVARMSALACASPQDAETLTKDLSQGRFQSKWGALPAALWLDMEASQDPGALRGFVLGGPEEVWNLAARHLPAPLSDVLAEARRASSLCAR